MIKKIDDDHYEVVTETTVIYSLSELEAELAEKQNYNKGIKLIHDELAKTPENLKKYIEWPLYEDTMIEEELLKKLKDTNG